MTIAQQLLVLASTCHKASISLFGYFIPALSSVKAVVRKDAEAYHQWCTYWLILHLHLTILSPILHLSLHPAFQILAVLWLSLPQYQGASVIYERIVTPWVNRYEERVDDAVDEAHRGVRRWVWSRLGGAMWALIGEGGSIAEGLLRVVMGIMQNGNAGESDNSRDDDGQSTIQPSSSAESLPPRHSVKEALSQSSSMEEVEGSYVDPTDDFVNDFTSMLQQGLYVFANVTSSDEAAWGGGGSITAGNAKHVFEGGFKLGIFSYAKDDKAFLVTPVVAGAHETDLNSSTSVRMHLDNEKAIDLRPSGSQGLVMERQHLRAEIVLSDESDRDILLNGLNVCLPRMITCKKKMG